eukprot:763026-Hanusia_phi.AAC.5
MRDFTWEERRGDERKRRRAKARVQDAQIETKRTRKCRQEMTTAQKKCCDCSKCSQSQEHVLARFVLSQKVQRQDM